MKSKKMVTYFNKRDLESFGSYLLSDKRKQLFEDSFEEKIKSGMKRPMRPEEAVKIVHHSDVKNWLDGLKS